MPAHEVNDAANRPTNKLGMHYLLALSLIGIAAVVLVTWSTLGGILLMFVLPFSIRWVLKKEPRICRIVELALSQRGSYDPRKETTA